MSDELLDALQARSGIVCAVGAGGKKTTLYALARAHPGRVGLTTTVFMTRFSRRFEGERLVCDADDPAAEVARAATHQRRVAWARPAEKSGRVGGVGVETIAPTHAAAGFDVTLVKADGARMRAIKAPRADEPVVPAAATSILCLVSAAAIGQPLDERIAHRPELVAAVSGLQPGAAITAEAVGRLLAAPEGALRNLPTAATVIPVINAVDNATQARAARIAAEVALAASARFDRVVLTCHGEAAEIVDIVTRT